MMDNYVICIQVMSYISFFRVCYGCVQKVPLVPVVPEVPYVVNCRQIRKLRVGTSRHKLDPTKKCH